MKTSKKASLLFLALICLVLSACAGGDNLKLSMFDLSREMLDSSSKFKEMSYASSEDQEPEKLLKNVSDIEYSKVSAFFISYASNGSKNADEIVVIEMKNAKDAKEAQSSLEKHLEYRRNLYASYDPSQSSKLLAGKVFSFKNVACLIVADDVKKVEDAFFGFIKK